MIFLVPDPLNEYEKMFFFEALSLSHSGKGHLLNAVNLILQNAILNARSSLNKYKKNVIQKLLEKTIHQRYSMVSHIISDKLPD